MKTPAHWQSRGVVAWLLWPLSCLFAGLAALRRAAYARGIKASTHPGLPVVVVGNITAGGSGKTPLVIALVKLFGQHGLRAGVVSRGYGGSGARPEGQEGVKTADVADLVTPDSDPAMVGDEPVLIAQHAGCPVVVGVNRASAADKLRETGDVDLVLTDDGLQHYALQRDIEIAVVDSTAGLGNGLLLPAGPLREPAWRLETVDYVVGNGDETGFDVMATGLVAVDGRQDVRAPSELSGQRVHAVAGIAAPEKFFALLRSFGATVVPHTFSDHHAFVPSDLAFESEDRIIMTEKDAVKCRQFATPDMWALRIEAVLARAWSEALLRQVTELVAHYKSYDKA